MRRMVSFNILRFTYCNTNKRIFVKENSVKIFICKKISYPLIKARCCTFIDLEIVCNSIVSVCIWMWWWLSVWHERRFRENQTSCARCRQLIAIANKRTDGESSKNIYTHTCKHLGWHVWIYCAYTRFSVLTTWHFIMCGVRRHSWTWATIRFLAFMPNRLWVNQSVV